jgi:hypothetical protein
MKKAGGNPPAFFIVWVTIKFLGRVENMMDFRVQLHVKKVKDTHLARLTNVW